MGGKTESVGKLTFRSMSRQQWQGLIALGVTYTTLWCCSVLVGPFFPPEGRKHGVSTSLNGMILSTGPAVNLFCSFAVSLLIVSVGPKLILLIGITLYGGGFAVFGFLEFIEPLTGFVSMTFILIFIQSVGRIFVHLSIMAFAGNIFPSNIGLIIGTMETLIAVAEGIALPSSGFIYEWGGFYLSFLVFSLLHLVSLPLCYFLLPKIKSGSRKVNAQTGMKDGPANIKPWHLFKIPRTMIVASLLPISAGYWAVLGANLEEHLSPLELTKVQTNSMFLVMSFWYAVACPIVGWGADKLSKTWPLIAIGMMGSGVTCLFHGPLPIFGLDNTVTVNAVVLTINTILQAVFIVPGYQAVLVHTIEAGYPDDVATYAVASSLFSTMDPIGSFTGTFAAGFTIERFGFPVSMAAIGCALFLGGSIITVYYACFDKEPKNHYRKRQKAQEPHEISLCQKEPGSLETI